MSIFGPAKTREMVKIDCRSGCPSWRLGFIFGKLFWLNSEIIFEIIFEIILLLVYTNYICTLKTACFAFENTQADKYQIVGLPAKAACPALLRRQPF